MEGDEGWSNAEFPRKLATHNRMKLAETSASQVGALLGLPELGMIYGGLIDLPFFSYDRILN